MKLIEALSVLELQYDFSEQELKDAYRKMARRYHPDIVGNDGTEKMQRINQAVTVCKKDLDRRVNDGVYVNKEKQSGSSRNHGSQTNGFYSRSKDVYRTTYQAYEFFAKLFEEHPEKIKDFFIQSRQR